MNMNLIKLLIIPAVILICTIWYRFSKKYYIPLLFILTAGITGVATGTYMNIGFFAEHRLLLLIVLAVILVSVILVRVVEAIIIPIAILVVLQACGIISGIHGLPKIPELPDISVPFAVTEQFQPELTEFDEIRDFSCT